MMNCSIISPIPSSEGQIKANFPPQSTSASALPGKMAPVEHSGSISSLDDISSTSSSAPPSCDDLPEDEHTPLPKLSSSSLQDEGVFPPAMHVDSNHTNSVPKSTTKRPNAHLTSVYCIDLPTQGSQGNLSHKFSNLPGYLSIHMPMRDARTSRGYAHVHFSDAESAKGAIDALQKHKFHHKLLKMRLSLPLSSNQVRRIKQGVKPLVQTPSPFSRIDEAAMRDDRRAKDRLIRDDLDRARWEPGYTALSEKLHLSSDMGDLCEKLNMELRSLEIEHPMDSEARRNFRVWAAHFKKVEQLSEILTGSKSQFSRFEDFKPSETDDRAKMRARDEVLTAMHRLAERAGNKGTFIEAFGGDIRYGREAKYETSFEWKGRKARQEIVHHFFGALEGSMRWRFIHEVYLEAVPLILRDMATFEKLVKRGYADLFTVHGEMRDGGLGEGDMDLEASDDD